MAMAIGPFDLNLRHLLAVSAIASQGSMSAAAGAVSLSQPALTQGLAKLERQLGVALFVRRTSGMEQTPEGAVLAGRVDRAIVCLSGAAHAPGRGFAKPERLMTATQLRAFLALADAGSFLAAAERTGLSQPAIHRAARDLEQIFAVPLAERRGRGVALTAAGRKVARAARLAAVEIAAAIAEIVRGPHGSGTIRIGAMPLSRARLLPYAISRFTQRCPDVRLTIIEGSWRDLEEPLRDGAIDLMIGALRLDPSPLDLTQTALFEDRLAAVGRADHPVARDAAPSLGLLADYPWIVGPEGSPLRAHWEALFADGVRPPAPIECGSVMMIREVLRTSDFLTLLSPDQVALEVEAGALAYVGPPLTRCVRTIGIAARAGWRPTPAQQLFIQLLHEGSADHRRDGGVHENE